MNNLKKVAILFAILTVLVFVSISYKGNDILKRAIILGIGVDKTDDGISVTVEIVSPGNGGEQVGMFSKTATASGRTIAEALQNIAEKTGKEASLGQCVLLVFGESFFQDDFSETVQFFFRSDSFCESAMVCCCKGSAQELMSNGDAVSQSVSLGLADKLKGISEDIAMPSCDLLTFARSQQELYKTGFLNYVHFEKTENTNPDNTEQTQGYFVCEQVAVFRDYTLVGILSAEETQGFALLAEKVVGTNFPVTDTNGKTITLRTNRKKLDTKQQDGVVSFAVTLIVQYGRADSFDSGGLFSAKTEEIPREMLNQAKEQALQLAQLFLQKQLEWEFDLLNIHELFRQKHGSTEKIKTLPMKNIPVNLTVDVNPT